MAKFLIEASYTAEGLKGLQRERAASRRAVVTRMVEDLGGKVEVFYWSLGERDAIVILDLPDVTTATALAFAVSSTGLVHTKTTSLVTGEEVDRALQKTVNYRAPGA
ncbi:MAG TPA: GYD domain-containing protein [Stellaceae bacterium]|nr:GYD domain-containing protein [Stellaceae bacterium]